MLVTARGGQDVPHAGATRLSVVVVVVVGHGRSTLKAVFTMG
jgi:hypothetical protein